MELCDFLVYSFFLHCWSSCKPVGNIAHSITRDWSNNFAASTLIKYCSALQNFHALLVDLRLQLEGLTENEPGGHSCGGALIQTFIGVNIISVNDDSKL